MKLFISYSSKDRALVETLHDDLDLLFGDAISIWYDRELNRSGGHQWWALILEAIRSCDIFLYALSGSVLKSEPCRREYGYARALGKPVLPVLIAETDIRLLPVELQKAQIVGMMDHSRDQLRSLRSSLLGLPPAPPLPDPLPAEPETPLDPVGALNDRIARLTADADAQRLLLLDIEELFDDEIHRAHAPEVLARLIERDDILFARILRRAQMLQARHPDPPTPPPAVDFPPPLVIPSTPSRLVLPDPFAWIDIPAGKVTLGEGYDGKGYIPKGKTQTFPVPAFAIAKYPITNAQFRGFVEAQGYQTERWWTPDGWRARGANNWTQPRFWGDADREPFSRPDHPVVGVSWFEAAAFCLWLSEAWSVRIMLPTEQMWQRAAQGDDGRAYPWGKDWDAARCQNSVGSRSSKHTAPVTQHAGRDKGDSPFEVSDMAGNVWEWCLTDYESGEQDENKSANIRVLRGGSWYYVSTEDFRVDHRLRNSPVDWIYVRGFRIARF